MFILYEILIHSLSLALYSFFSGLSFKKGSVSPPSLTHLVHMLLSHASAFKLIPFVTHLSLYVCHGPQHASLILLLYTDRTSSPSYIVTLQVHMTYVTHG